MLRATAASVALHGALLFALRGGTVPRPAPAEPRPEPDVWAGISLELPGREAPAGAGEGPRVSHDAPFAPPVSEPEPAAEASPRGAEASRVEARPTPAPAAQEPERPAGAPEPALKRKAPSAPTPPAASGEASAHAEGGTRASPAQSGADGVGAPEGARGTVAEGRGAPRDLGRAFTRAIGSTNLADAAWGKLPLGDAGTLEVALRVDDAGKIVEVRPLGEAPPARLVSLAKRTVALLGGGAFALRPGAVAAGEARLRLRASVSTAEAPPVEGGHVAIAYEYEAGRGKASFVQPGGRRVEVGVEVLGASAAIP